MGLAALRRLLAIEPASLADFTGKVVAVDADNQLWTFVTAMGAAGDVPKAPDGRPVAHVIGLANRLKLYADHGIRSAWAFDGEQPALKAGTLAARQDARPADAAGLTAPQVAEAQVMLTALGVPWIIAPGESDAQCAHLAHEGNAFAAVTQDYDAALHASPRTARNLTQSKARSPEVIDLEKSLADAGLTREQLVDVAILIGTDYNDGVKGVGPVKAVKLVKSEGDLHGALAKLGADMPEAEEVRELFLKHPVDRSWEPRWRAPDEDTFRALIRSAGLGEDRATRVLDAVRASHG